MNVPAQTKRVNFLFFCVIVQFSPSTDWMMPTSTDKVLGGFLECDSLPETPSWSRPDYLDISYSIRLTHKADDHKSALCQLHTHMRLLNHI